MSKDSTDTSDIGNINNYLLKETDYDESTRQWLFEQICKYSDIRNEFLSWLVYKNFDMPNAIAINGMTAQLVSMKAPHFDASEVYVFMVMLRDNPRRAEKYLKYKFPSRLTADEASHG